MTPTTLTIRHAQTNQPWTMPYDERVMKAEGLVPHILATHAVLHAAKTVGKLSAVFEALDHRVAPPTQDHLEVIKGMSADLVTIGLRLANLYGFDLASELVRRVEEKNRVNLLEI